jgi:hypothetical protein
MTLPLGVRPNTPTNSINLPSLKHQLRHHHRAWIHLGYNICQERNADISIHSAMPGHDDVHVQATFEKPLKDSNVSLYGS